ncbi:MAG: ATP-binding protein [bacterium]|nr:ATP-binding protein [bacterium]
MSIESGYHTVLKRLMTRIDEPAPGRIQMLTGPRQVGKTTILLEIARKWGKSALYLAADAPEAALPGWWEIQWRRALQLARSGKAVLLLDEIQYLPNWSRLVKAGIDEVYREKLPLHIVITGSAALEVGAGARETMAGRYERLALCQWTTRDLAEAFSMNEEQAILCYIRYGSFPGGINLLSDIMRWKAYIRDSIIDPAIGRDLLMLETVRKPALLRQVFAVCAGHPAEILSLGKIAGEITDAGTLETVAHYLNVLGEAYLIAAVRKFSATELRRRSSPPKLVPLSNTFLAASLEGEPPLPETDPVRWGRWVENACLAFAVNNGQTVHYWREEPIEVDGIFSGSWGKWAVEIKTGGYTAGDLSGLLEFSRRWPEYRPLVICDDKHADTAQRIGIDCLTWNKFLWDGITGS